MMPRQGTVVADRYRLERKVGGGRVAAMWRVQDQVTDAACAIKLLHRSMNDHPEALARFSLEDRLSRELTGDYFPERVGSGSWHSLRYIAWRWYEGECLRSLFDRNPKQDVQTVYSIVQETCQALTLVHAAGYSHGDLKPENLFFADRAGDSSRQLKLLGFGVASRLARPLLGSQARRTPGQIVGTPLYLSPDLILGRVPRGGQADLWALAVIVYEALTGRAPFLGTDLTEVLEAILERRAARPSTITNLPATFDVWWTQALEQHFVTASDFSTSLARALAPALRSSRTQRSASLPDRVSPTGQGLVWRSDAATPRVQPGAVQPGAVQPEAVQPGAVQPGAVQPGAVQPEAVQPEAVQPEAVQPEAATAQGGTVAPSTNELRAANELRSTAVAAAAAAAMPTAVTSTAVAAADATSALGAKTAANGSASARVAGTTNAVASPAAVSPPAASPPKPGTDAASAATPAEVSAHAASSLQSPPAAVAAAAPNLAAADLAAAAAPAAARPGSDSPAAPTAPATSGPAAPGARGLSSLASSTAVGVGSSPLASSPGANAPAPVPAGGATAAGIGRAADGSSLVAAARAKAESTAPNPLRPEPPRPEPGASRPQHGAPAASAAPRQAQRSAEASAAPEPQRPNVTSTTVAGIGPAALSLMRSRESAATAGKPNTASSARADGGATDTAGNAAATAAQASGSLAALRDLAIGTRKTLVGIFPPAAPPPAAAPATPVPAVAPPASQAPAAVTKSQSLVISGTPCRSIDISADDDEAIDSVVPLRRLGHATVPFPRPRAAARSAWLGDGRTDDMVVDQSQDAPQSWRRRTHNTLRVVLTDPDHRPHLVAGLLVCSAAALVIFALGRSPVSGTGMLGQTTGSLSGREGTSLPADQPIGSRSAAAGPLDPSGKAQESATASPQGSASASALPGSEPSAQAGAKSEPVTSGPALQGEELAPGLVVPPRATPPAPAAPPGPAKPTGTAPMPPGAVLAPAPARPPAAPAGARPAAAPASAAPVAPRPAVPAPAPGAPPRAVPPRKPGTEPAPPRPTNPDFDFGI